MINHNHRNSLSYFSHVLFTTTFEILQNDIDTQIRTQTHLETHADIPRNTHVYPHAHTYTHSIHTRTNASIELDSKDRSQDGFSISSPDLLKIVVKFNLNISLSPTK